MTASRAALGPEPLAQAAGDRLELPLAESRGAGHEARALRTCDLERVTVDITDSGMEPPNLLLHQPSPIRQQGPDLGGLPFAGHIVIDPPLPLATNAPRKINVPEVPMPA